MHKNERPFDVELLRRPVEDRLAYFAQYKCEHHRLKEVADKVTSAVLHPNGKNFVFMVGPPRAGKTTVQYHIVRRLLNEFHTVIMDNPGSMPVAWIESSAYPASYNWKDHWVTCLRALNEPLVEHKSLPREGSRYLTTGAQSIGGKAGAAPAVRYSFFTAAIERLLRALIVDEAHHMRKALTRARVIDNAEILKTDASKSQAVFVLCGTYDLLDLANLNGQLGCRTDIVHFSRYLTTDADLESFGMAALTLVDHMPLYDCPDLSAHLNYCYEISLGCIGLLKMWLYQTLKAVLVKNRKTLTIADLRQNEPPLDVRLAVAKEINRGEGKLLQDNSKEERIRIYMGFDKAGASTEVPRNQDRPTEGREPDLEGSNGRNKSKRPTAKPGHRKPKRDPVGEGRKKHAE